MPRARALVVQLGLLDDQLLGLAVAFDPSGLAKKSNTMRLGLLARSSLNSRRMVTDLRWPGSSASSASTRREIIELDQRQRRFQMPEFAQFLGVMAIWCGPRRPRIVMVRIAEPSSASSAWPTMSEPSNSFAGLRQDPRDIEGDIAVADDRRMRAVERRIEIGEIGVAVVPADELGRADDAGQILARDAELAVVRRADRQDDRIIEIEQFGDRNVAADADIADEADARAFGDLVVALDTALSDWWSGATPKRIRP